MQIKVTSGGHREHLSACRRAHIESTVPSGTRGYFCVLSSSTWSPVVTALTITRARSVGKGTATSCALVEQIPIIDLTLLNRDQDGSRYGGAGAGASIAGAE